eukprot:9783036-Alexandrium_andersonii.AAC.1
MCIRDSCSKCYGRVDLEKAAQPLVGEKFARVLASTALAEYSGPRTPNVGQALGSWVETAKDLMPGCGLA